MPAGAHGNRVDVTVSEGLRITEQVKLGVVLRIMPKYLRPGAHEALHVLVNAPTFYNLTRMTRLGAAGP